ncbi:MAG: 4Fe-4S binding protein [Clostridia bacterium]
MEDKKKLQKPKKKRGALQKQKNKRTLIQTLFFALTNSYVIGFLQGTIYKGNLKNICVPGLNCYSCPGAWGACPIGALQAILNKRNFSVDPVTGALAKAPANYFSFYVVGFMMIVGAICGRLVCGFLCPFGWIQELLHKIPLPKKLKVKTFPGDKQLRYLKYLVLIGLVFLLPIFAAEAFPYFCKFLCPSGMLIGGIPLMALNEGIRDAAGMFTVLKLSILGVIVIASIIIYRPFCKYLCPLGAIYSVMNPISLYRMSVDESQCTNCGLCAKVCDMGVDIRKTPNSLECIRCGDCRAACPTHAISAGFSRGKLKARITNEEVVIK